jgi:hypothetical protein
MTTPTVITFPSIANPAKVDWMLHRFDGRFESPLSGSIQQLLRPGARWEATFSWTTLSEADWHQLAAWWNQMAQANYRCALPNYAYQALGSLAGTPLVNGAAQTGSTLATKGWTASASGVLKAGDMFQITDGTKHQLVMVTADANADGLGHSSVSITPPLRISPTDASALVVANPTARFMLSNGDTSLSFQPPRLSSASLSLIEDILI